MARLPGKHGIGIAHKVKTTVTYICDGEEITVENPWYDHEGGCHGHHNDPDDRCYCPSIEITVNINKCSRCGRTHSFYLY